MIRMPVEYVICADVGVVVSRCLGTVNTEDLVQHQEDLRADASFQPDYNQLLDFEQAQRLQLDTNGIKVLASRNPFSSGSKRAFVVHPDSPVAYGFMRMYQILTSDHPDELRVQFNDIEAACKWLGVEPDCLKRS